MRINYFSDLHLEFGSLASPMVDADLIIAAGDIGTLNEGSEWLKALDRPVIYIAGNHEFYDRDYHEALTDIRQACSNSPVQFLEQQTVIVEGVRFLGCTLWADIFTDGETTAAKLQKQLNDFKKIKYTQDAFTIDQFYQLNRQATAWLEQALAEPFSGKTVVVTHHAPSEWSWNKSPRMLKKHAYCNDLKGLMHEYEIDAWFHGHVHSVGDYRIAGTRILCNPRGYYPDKLVNQFDINKFIEL